MVIIQIAKKLFFATGVIFFSMPDLHFNDILFSKIINDQICSPHTSGSRFDIVVSCSIDQRPDIQKKQFSAIFFNKRLVINKKPYTAQEKIVFFLMFAFVFMFINFVIYLYYTNEDIHNLLFLQHIVYADCQKQTHML